jgi:hypothetical protein
VCADQSMRPCPSPRKPGWDGLCVRGALSASAMIQGRLSVTAPTLEVPVSMVRSQRSFLIIWRRASSNHKPFRGEEGLGPVTGYARYYKIGKVEVDPAVDGERSDDTATTLRAIRQAPGGRRAAAPTGSTAARGTGNTTGGAAGRRARRGKRDNREFTKPHRRREGAAHAYVYVCMHSVGLRLAGCRAHRP